MIAAVTFMAHTSNAQENSTDFRDQFQFGLKAGINYSNVYKATGEEFEADAKFGFVAGLFVMVPIGEKLGIQPEILFSQKGFKATGIILENTYELTRTTNYIDVPLLFSFKPSEVVSLLAGPQFSYLLNKKDVFENATSSAEQEEEFENENIRKSTLCFVGGLDFNLNHLVLGARVGWDLMKNNVDEAATTPRYKNFWYQITAGYRFYD